MKIVLCLFAFPALGLTSCLTMTPSECHSTVVAPVLSATGPKTVAVNQPAIFALNYALASSCGKFNSVSDETIAVPNTRLVGVKVDYEGCNCPQTTIPAQAIYAFQPTQPGTYYLKFAVGTSFLTDTLVVK